MQYIFMIYNSVVKLAIFLKLAQQITQKNAPKML